MRFWAARDRPEPQNDRFFIKSLNPPLLNPPLATAEIFTLSGGPTRPGILTQIIKSVWARSAQHLTISSCQKSGFARGRPEPQNPLGRPGAVRGRPEPQNDRFFIKSLNHPLLNPPLATPDTFARTPGSFKRTPGSFKRIPGIFLKIVKRSHQK